MERADLPSARIAASTGTAIHPRQETPPVRWQAPVPVARRRNRASRDPYAHSGPRPASPFGTAPDPEDPNANLEPNSCSRPPSHHSRGRPGESACLATTCSEALATGLARPYRRGSSWAIPDTPRLCNQVRQTPWRGKSLESRRSHSEHDSPRRIPTSCPTSALTRSHLHCWFGGRAGTGGSFVGARGSRPGFHVLFQLIVQRPHGFCLTRVTLHHRGLRRQAYPAKAALNRIVSVRAASGRHERDSTADAMVIEPRGK